ncbi:HNH endonuclease signature motif containing protein [Luteipulveratus mongoliensis]|uniref:HNH endonuclease signature motif containing protein n=1 Tax=Luteipulveratus mongoliensis TaxID=571913 RepID=UPI0006978455|nr:HNH endonuclease signature motif containing protein [Luteipulveratus mongoliensis]
MDEAAHDTDGSPDGESLPGESLVSRVPPGPAADAVSAAAAAVVALEGLPSALHQVGSADLAPLVELLGVLVDRVQACVVMATAEALERGVVRESQAASPAQWVAAHAGRLEPGEASRVATVAAAVNQPDNVLLREAVASGACSARAAQVSLRELGKILPVLPGFARQECLAYFVQVAAAGGGAKELRHLSRWLVATYAGDQLEDQDAALERVEELSWSDLPGGLRRFIVDLAPGNAARLVAAVQAGAGPRPVVDPDTGASSPDPRSPGKRRADAFMDLIDLATSTDASTSHGSTTKLVVTMGLDDLRAEHARTRAAGAGHPSAGAARAGAARADRGRAGGLGVTSLGDTVDAGTIRRMACDADIIPMVLGSRSEPLDVGREQRLVKDGLRAAVVARDRCCTFPGCDRPPSFCEVHHVQPWYAGGRTSLLNSALLCRRHHAIVHRDNLTATVTPFTVHWHRGAASGVSAPTDAMGKVSSSANGP